MNKHTALPSYVPAKEIQSIVGVKTLHILSMDFETPQGHEPSTLRFPSAAY